MKTTFKVRDLQIPRRKLEALVDALVHHSGYRDPKSPVYQARNPGGLKAFQPDHAKDANGLRIFPSELDGLQAALWDMAYKLSGQSVARLTPERNITDLVTSYGMPEATAKFWSNFLKHALGNENIHSTTQLYYFLNEDK